MEHRCLLLLFVKSAVFLYFLLIFTEPELGCQELKVDYCRDIGYNTTFIPNFFNQSSQVRTKTGIPYKWDNSNTTSIAVFVKLNYYMKNVSVIHLVLANYRLLSCQRFCLQIFLITYFKVVLSISICPLYIKLSPLYQVVSSISTLNQVIPSTSYSLYIKLSPLYQVVSSISSCLPLY